MHWQSCGCVRAVLASAALFRLRSKQLTLKKQRQEIMATSLSLLKDKFKGFSFSGKFN